MQPSPSPSPTDCVCEHFGITGHKTLREFEVIAQAKSRGYKGARAIRPCVGGGDNVFN